ncbi:MAG: universal stress protein [Thermomicrobiales bacterium]
MDASTFGSPLLVPFDGSANAEAILSYVPMLVSDGRKVILLQVIPEARDLCSPLGDVSISAADLQAASETAARADLDRAAARLTGLDPSIEIEQVVAVGDPSEQIARVALDTAASGIVIGSQGISATGPGGFGSVVGRVARTTPVPLLVVQPKAAANTPEIARFVIAHDGSERAGRVLPLVKDLAKRLAAHIHLVAVVQDERSPIAAAATDSLDSHTIEMFHGDARRIAQQHLESVGATLLRGGVSASWQVLTGPAAPAIIDACAPHDVLVITSHGRADSRWMLGSVAEKLIRESPVPILLLRTPPEPRDGGKP